MDAVGRCRPVCGAGAPGGGPRTCPPLLPVCWGRPRGPWGPRAGQSATRRGPERRAPAGQRRRACGWRALVSPVWLAGVQRLRACWPPAPVGPPRGRRGRDRRLPVRRRGLPGAASRAPRGSPRRPPAPTRPRAPRACPRQARRLGWLPGARGGGAPPPRRACRAHGPEHAARRGHAGQAGGCGLGNVGRTGRTGVTATAPMRRRRRGRPRGQASRGARGALARSPCPGIALLSGSMGAMRREPPERGVPANRRH
jgi:hypothetical protein